MRAVIQVADGASVSVEQAALGCDFEADSGIAVLNPDSSSEPGYQQTGAFDGEGLVVLLGVTHTDGQSDVDTMVRKIAELRILRGERSAAEADAPILVISQFTLYGSTKKGRRPSWSHAAPGEVAEPLVEAVVAGLRARGLSVGTGRFGAMMRLSLVNNGPFTVLVET